MDYQGLLNSFKRGVYSPVYLLYGEETYLRDEILALFKKNMLPAEVSDFNMDILDGQEITPESLVDMANTLPFMSEKRLIIVNDTKWFSSGKKTTKENSSEEEKGAVQDTVLINYMENILDSTCLIFTADSVDKRKKLYKAVEKVGQVVEFTPLKGKELNDWVAAKARHLGKKIDPEALARIVTAVGSNIRLIENELAKLAFFVKDRNEIKLKDVEQMVSKTVENSIFEMVDAVGERRHNKALQIIHEMIFYGEPPIRILFMIVRQFRLILASKIMSDQGSAEKQIASAIKVHPFVAQKCIRQSRNFSRDELEKALSLLLEADEAMKTGKQEPVFAMERLIIELCS